MKVEHLANDRTVNVLIAKERPRHSSREYYSDRYGDGRRKARPELTLKKMEEGSSNVNSL